MEGNCFIITSVYCFSLRMKMFFFPIPPITVQQCFSPEIISRWFVSSQYGKTIIQITPGISFWTGRFIFLAGFTEVFPLLPGSGLGNMIALYGEQRDAVGVFCQAKSPNDAFLKRIIQKHNDFYKEFYLITKRGCSLSFSF
jgi:hypothetical protein